MMFEDAQSLAEKMAALLRSGGTAASPCRKDTCCSTRFSQQL